MNLLEQCKQAIIKNDIKKAFVILDDILRGKPMFQDQLIILKSRYNDVKQKEIKGVLSADESNVVQNRFRASLLGLINEIEEEYFIETYKYHSTVKGQKLKIFISYAHKDDSFRQELDTFLVMLKRQGLVDIWSDREILAGQNWSKEISKNIEDADLIIPLISADFIASDYSYEIEMSRALERHDAGVAVLAPIIIRPCSWQDSPFVNFQALPSGGKPITNWLNRDDAWLNVYSGISNLCKSIIHERNNQKTNTVFSRGLDSIFDKVPNKQIPLYKIGVFGETGSGKSTLCNALLGKESMRVSDITPITRSVQSAKMNFPDFELEIIDCPGLGESVEEDVRIIKIYEELFLEVDFIIWVLRADVRSYSYEQRFIDKIKELEDNNKSFCIALNMIDRITLNNSDWNFEEKKPSKNLIYLVDRKTMYISGLFRVPPPKIIATAGLMKYNVNEIFSLIIELVKYKDSH